MFTLCIALQVGVANKKLYIVNGNFKCEKGGCDAESAEAVALMQRMTQTFDVI